MLRRFRRTNEDAGPPLSVEAEAAAELRRAAEALGVPPAAGEAPVPSPPDGPMEPVAAQAAEEGGAVGPVEAPATEASAAVTVRRVRKLPPAREATDGRVDRAGPRAGPARGPAAGRAPRARRG